MLWGFLTSQYKTVCRLVPPIHSQILPFISFSFTRAGFAFADHVQAVGAGGKRSSSISEDKELFSMQSSLFAPARRPAAASKQAIKRKRQPLTVSTEDEEDEYVKWNPR